MTSPNESVKAKNVNEVLTVLQIEGDTYAHAIISVYFF